MSSPAVPRRAFLESCAVLAAALSGCAPLANRARLARLALEDPHPRDYAPTLLAALEAIIPFEHAAFPAVAAAELRARFLELYPVEKEDDYAAIQGALMLFDAVDLFPERHPVFAADERDLFGASDAEAAARIEADARRYAAFLRDHGLEEGSPRFAGLALVARRGYFALWLGSDLGARRRFARALKSLAMITCYSDDRLWRAIGYGGPLVQGRA